MDNDDLLFSGKTNGHAEHLSKTVNVNAQASIYECVT